MVESFSPLEKFLSRFAREKVDEKIAIDEAAQDLGIPNAMDPGQVIRNHLEDDPDSSRTLKQMEKTVAGEHINTGWDVTDSAADDVREFYSTDDGSLFDALTKYPANRSFGSWSKEREDGRRQEEGWGRRDWVKTVTTAVVGGFMVLFGWNTGEYLENQSRNTFIGHLLGDEVFSGYATYSGDLREIRADGRFDYGFLFVDSPSLLRRRMSEYMDNIDSGSDVEEYMFKRYVDELYQNSKLVFLDSEEDYLYSGEARIVYGDSSPFVQGPGEGVLEPGQLGSERDVKPFLNEFYKYNDNVSDYNTEDMVFPWEMELLLNKNTYNIDALMPDLLSELPGMGIALERDYGRKIIGDGLRLPGYSLIEVTKIRTG